jgi:excisionase family DNA binding protein
VNDVALKPGEKLALSVVEAAQAVGICRSKLYEEIEQGKLESLKVGGRRLVRVSALQRWLDSHAA